ncbi:MAG TPA: DUF1540 domain-containing protein [Selenomonadales bacterium]|nr:DUF1540 domain-containing protein [Selenomonadales bacterium]
MSSENPVVKCTVDQCTHWMQGNQCMASKIGIYNDEAKGDSSASADTQCKSFHANKGIGDMVGALHNANIGGTVRAAFAEGTQITPTVECYVNNCKYWNEGNYCHASAIEVDGLNAAKTTDTDCKTFEVR